MRSMSLTLNDHDSSCVSNVRRSPRKFQSFTVPYLIYCSGAREMNFPMAKFDNSITGEVITARSLRSVVRFVSVMITRGAAIKRLQAMAVDLHTAFVIKMKSGKFLGKIWGDSINVNDKHHYEFSWSRPSMYETRRRRQRRWDRRSLFKALPCIHHTCSDEKELVEPSHDDQEFCCPDSNVDSPCYTSTTCNTNHQSEVDRRAEEFIAKFHHQMRLQRQDSYQKWQEMLARGSS